MFIHERCLDHMAIVNDLYSYNREIKTENNPTYILSLITLDEAISLIYKLQDKIKTSNLVINGINYSESLTNYCENLKYFCAGNLKWSRETIRYSKEK